MLANGKADEMLYERGALVPSRQSDNGIAMTQTEFQQTILKDTRAGEIFIGANDHGRSRGYFLIQERVDAVTMREFYRKPIAAEQANFANLDRLIQIEWPGH